MANKTYNELRLDSRRVPGSETFDQSKNGEPREM